MSENSLEEITGHLPVNWRASARKLLSELGYTQEGNNQFMNFEVNNVRR